MQKWRKKMGMTIDNAITWLNTDDFESKGFADATSIAIDTMRKYQKIQEIAEQLKGLSIDEMSYVEFRIREILDGNGNN